ncbi:hypothetical protein BLNAU_1338 [Blattamonas nauphoetae]|uniref:Uncharacterized protein n=1 Tax=Blattamonas nauphoetae TaxID=2049346 RepID=A0ABQ9YJE7_9EUKA|nr:hypothetical protein BLNAU_1338 [Blattamonas nauphoetae]
MQVHHPVLPPLRLGSPPISREHTPQSRAGKTSKQQSLNNSQTINTKYLNSSIVWGDQPRPVSSMDNSATKSNRTNILTTTYQPRRTSAVSRPDGKSRPKQVDIVQPRTQPFNLKFVRDGSVFNLPILGDPKSLEPKKDSLKENRLAHLHIAQNLRHSHQIQPHRSRTPPTTANSRSDLPDVSRSIAPRNQTKPTHTRSKSTLPPTTKPEKELSPKPSPVLPYRELSGNNGLYPLRLSQIHYEPIIWNEQKSQIPFSPSFTMYPPTNEDWWEDEDSHSAHYDYTALSHKSDRSKKSQITSALGWHSPLNSSRHSSHHSSLRSSRHSSRRSSSSNSRRSSRRNSAFTIDSDSSGNRTPCNPILTDWPSYEAFFVPIEKPQLLPTEALPDCPSITIGHPVPLSHLLSTDLSDTNLTSTLKPAEEEVGQPVMISLQSVKNLMEFERRTQSKPLLKIKTEMNVNFAQNRVMPFSAKATSTTQLERFPISPTHSTMTRHVRGASLMSFSSLVESNDNFKTVYPTDTGSIVPTHGSQKHRQTVDKSGIITTKVHVGPGGVKDGVITVDTPDDYADLPVSDKSTIRSTLVRKQTVYDTPNNRGSIASFQSSNPTIPSLHLRTDSDATSVASRALHLSHPTSPTAGKVEVDAEEIEAEIKILQEELVRTQRLKKLEARYSLPQAEWVKKTRERKELGTVLNNLLSRSSGETLHQRNQKKRLLGSIVHKQKTQLDATPLVKQADEIQKTFETDLRSVQKSLMEPIDELDTVRSVTVNTDSMSEVETLHEDSIFSSINSSFVYNRSSNRSLPQVQAVPSGVIKVTLTDKPATQSTPHLNPSMASTDAFEFLDRAVSSPTSSSVQVVDLDRLTPTQQIANQTAVGARVPSPEVLHSRSTSLNFLSPSIIPPEDPPQLRSSVSATVLNQIMDISPDQMDQFNLAPPINEIAFQPSRHKRSTSHTSFTSPDQSESPNFLGRITPPRKTLLVPPRPLKRQATKMIVASETRDAVLTWSHLTNSSYTQKEKEAYKQFQMNQKEDGEGAGHANRFKSRLQRLGVLTSGPTSNKTPMALLSNLMARWQKTSGNTESKSALLAPQTIVQVFGEGVTLTMAIQQNQAAITIQTFVRSVLQRRKWLKRRREIERRRQNALSKAFTGWQYVTVKNIRAQNIAIVTVNIYETWLQLFVLRHWRNDWLRRKRRLARNEKIIRYNHRKAIKESVFEEWKNWAAPRILRSRIQKSVQFKRFVLRRQCTKLFIFWSAYATYKQQIKDRSFRYFRLGEDSVPKLLNRWSNVPYLADLRDNMRRKDILERVIVRIWFVRLCSPAFYEWRYLLEARKKKIIARRMGLINIQRRVLQAYAEYVRRQVAYRKRKQAEEQLRTEFDVASGGMGEAYQLWRRARAEKCQNELPQIKEKVASFLTDLGQFETEMQIRREARQADFNSYVTELKNMLRRNEEEEEVEEEADLLSLEPDIPFLDVDFNENTLSSISIPSLPSGRIPSSLLSPITSSAVTSRRSSLSISQLSDTDAQEMKEVHDDYVNYMKRQQKEKRVDSILQSLGMSQYEDFDQPVRSRAPVDDGDYTVVTKKTLLPFGKSYRKEKKAREGVKDPPTDWNAGRRPNIHSTNRAGRSLINSRRNSAYGSIEEVDVLEDESVISEGTSRPLSEERELESDQPRNEAFKPVYTRLPKSMMKQNKVKLVRNELPQHVAPTVLPLASDGARTPHSVVPSTPSPSTKESPHPRTSSNASGSDAPVSKLSHTVTVNDDGSIADEEVHYRDYEEKEMIRLTKEYETRLHTQNRQPFEEKEDPTKQKARALPKLPPEYLKRRPSRTFTAEELETQKEDEIRAILGLSTDELDWTTVADALEELDLGEKTELSKEKIPVSQEKVRKEQKKQEERKQEIKRNVQTMLPSYLQNTSFVDADKTKERINSHKKRFFSDLQKQKGGLTVLFSQKKK